MRTALQAGTVGTQANGQVQVETLAPIFSLLDSGNVLLHYIGIYIHIGIQYECLAIASILHCNTFLPDEIFGVFC